LAKIFAKELHRLQINQRTMKKETKESIITTIVGSFIGSFIGSFFGSLLIQAIFG